MTNIRYPISSDQLEDFKLHAGTFAKVLCSIDSSCVLKGRKRVDSLAKACGYTNHGQLVVLAKGYEHATALRLFVPEHTFTIAEKLSELTGLKYEVVAAAIIQSANELYDDDRWTVGDIKKCGNEVFGLVFPASKKIAESINRFAAPAMQIEKWMKPFGLPKAIQDFIDMQNRLVPPVVRKLTEHSNRFNGIFPVYSSTTEIGKAFKQSGFESTMGKLSVLNNSKFSLISEKLNRTNHLFASQNNALEIGNAFKQSGFESTMDKLSVLNNSKFSLISEKLNRTNSLFASQNNAFSEVLAKMEKSELQ